MSNILVLALAFFAFGEGIVIEPHTSEQIDPSVNGESILICSYEGVEACGSTCYPAKVLIGDETVSPSDGSFTVEVQEEPIVIKNGGDVSINCEFMSQGPPCELLEPPPAIAQDDLVDGCPDCVGKRTSQVRQLSNDASGEDFCEGVRIGRTTVLTAAECARSQSSFSTFSFTVDSFLDDLAILRLDVSDTDVFDEPPCICSSNPASQSYIDIFSNNFTAIPCELCQNLTNTQVCTMVVDPNSYLPTNAIGTGLYVTNEDDEEVLCGILLRGTPGDGELFNNSESFNVINLSSYYNQINELIDEC